MSEKKFVSSNVLEEAVMSIDNSAVVELIASGSRLDRPDVLATQEAFSLYYPAAVLLIESSDCLKTTTAVERLEELCANPKMIEMVRESANELPQNGNPNSGKLIEAISSGDELDVLNLIVNGEATLSSAPLEIFDNMDKLCRFTVENLFDKAIGKRLQSRLFLHLKNLADNEVTPKADLLYDTMKLIISGPETAVRSNRLYALWHARTAPPYALTVEKEPEKFTDEFLADGLIDHDLDPAVRAFNDFPAYYQAYLLNNGGVSIGQFDEEANVESYDAKAVFELLSASDEYADRVNWVLVNLTAKASDFLKFLAKNPQYAANADWQMINVQTEPETWLDFLEKQPGLLDFCLDHKALYMADPDRWEKIAAESGIQLSNCYAYMERIDDEPDWTYCFKTRVLDDHADFLEVNDLFTYKKFSALSRTDFAGFSHALQNGDANGRFVNIIR